VAIGVVTCSEVNECQCYPYKGVVRIFNKIPNISDSL